MKMSTKELMTPESFASSCSYVCVIPNANCCNVPWKLPLKSVVCHTINTPHTLYNCYGLDQGNVLQNISTTMCGTLHKCNITLAHWVTLVQTH